LKILSYIVYALLSSGHGVHDILLAVRRGPNHGDSNRYRKFGEFLTRMFWDASADRQSNRQSNIPTRWPQY